ncbi:MAG: twin transmembrane helix small protein [Sulfuricaulis sp.]
MGASIIPIPDISPVYRMLIKIVVLVMLALILVSLFSALVFLFKDKGQGKRTAQALTWRIGLSMALFLLLMAGFHFGLIPPQGLSLFR